MSKAAHGRVREHGVMALSNIELLSVALGGEREEVAKALLATADGSLRRLAQSSFTYGQLKNVDGIGDILHDRMAAIFEIGRRLAREGPHDRSKIRGPRDVYELLGPSYRDATQESFIVLCMNVQHAVIREVEVTRGTADTCLVHPREIFRQAVAVNSVAIILAHNHPSGDPTPSVEDRDITRQVVEAGKIVGIPVVDHIIIGDARYVSFVEAGLLSLEGGDR